MDIEIRRELEDEHFAVEKLIRKAFFSEERPECNEHLMVHQLRQSKDFIKELDLVAVLNGTVVGNIICSMCRIVDENQVENYKDIIAIGPIGVLPEYQKQGIGSLMINSVRNMASQMGFLGIVLYGHPEYYKRFGFVNAEKFKITTPENTNFDAFMAIELSPGSLDNIRGRCYESSAFEVDRDKLIEFDKYFQ